MRCSDVSCPVWLQVYASDEGRVQMTAAAFTKGLLDLEGNLASILVHLVKRDENATEMLDSATESTELLDRLVGTHTSPLSSVAATGSSRGYTSICSPQKTSVTRLLTKSA